MIRFAAILPARPWTLLVIAFAGYCTLLLAIYLLQDRMLYFPEPDSRAGLEARAKSHRFRIWPRGATDYHGFVQEDPAGPSKGVILLCHGNAGSALDRVFYGEELAHLGYRLILLEYPGYGARAGNLREASLVSAALEAARAAGEQFGGPLYLYGESLGCGVASAVAGSGKVPVAGVVLITPWDTLPDMAQSMFWYLPARWLTRDRYDNVRNLDRYNGSVVVAVAENDEVIPPRHGLRLFGLLSNRKKLWVMPGAGHNSWPAVVDHAWWNEVMGFVTAEKTSGDGSGGYPRKNPGRDAPRDPGS